MAVPLQSYQKLLGKKEKHPDILIHGRYGLPLLHIINYPKYIPLVAAVGQYKEYIVNKGTGREPIFVKSDGYPMQIVQLESTIDTLDMKRREYLYACTTNGLGRGQRDA